MVSKILGPNGRPIERKSEPLNANWWTWIGEHSEGFYNPDPTGLDVYTRMIETDESVYSGLQFLIMSALSRLGDYTHEDNDKEEFILRNFSEMEGSLPGAIEEMLWAGLGYGFGITEKIWRKRGNQIWLRKLQTLHPETIMLDKHREGPMKNELSHIWQFWNTHQQVEIPREKAIVFTSKGFFGNDYGKSWLRGAYKSWKIKEIMLKCWALCCERYGTPYTVATVENSAERVNGPDGPMNAFEYVGKVMNSLGKSGSLVLPPGVQAEIIYAARGFGEDFENLVGYCNKMIYRALGLPSLIADHGNTGSYSLGKQHFKLFTLVMEQLLNEIIEVLLEQLVRPLLEMNFGPQEDLGDFSVEQFEIEDEKMIAEIILDLKKSGLVSTERLKDMNYLRERAGIPLLEEEDLEVFVPAEEPEKESDSEENLEEEPERFCTSWAARRRRRRAVRARRRRRAA